MIIIHGKFPASSESFPCCIKNRVYDTPVFDSEELKSGIQSSCGYCVNVFCVTEDMLQNSRQEVEYCLDILRATKGVLVEVYKCKWS